jgi:hypothetical protein
MISYIVWQTKLKTPRAKALLGQLLLLALLFVAMIWGLSTDIPNWLQLTGWAFFAANLVAGSIYVILRRSRIYRQDWPISLLPQSWRCWFIDESSRKSKSYDAHSRRAKP